MNFYILLFKLKTVEKSRTRFSLWGRCGTCVDSTKNKHIARNVNLGHVKDLLVGEENLSDGKGGYVLKVESQSWQVVVHCAGDGILSSAEFRAAPSFRDWGYTATGWSRYSLLSVWYRQVSVNGRHKVSHKIGGEGHCFVFSCIMTEYTTTLMARIRNTHGQVAVDPVDLKLLTFIKRFCRKGVSRNGESKWQWFVSWKM